MAFLHVTFINMQQNKKNILKLKKNEEKFGREKESSYLCRRN